MSDMDKIAGLRWAAEKCERERVHQLRLLSHVCPDDSCAERTSEVYESRAQTASDLRRIMVEEAARVERESRPDQRAIHNVPAPFTPQRAGNLSRLTLRLVADWQLTSDRAASVAACVDADGSFLRLNWLACCLPLPTHEERVAAAEKLLTECGYVR
jgi:hypothetical protein